VSEPAERLTVEIERVLPVPRPTAFELFSAPAELSKWWGPNGFSIPGLSFEPRVGEPYRIEMQPPEGDPFHLTGEFREVDPPSRLAFTFVWEPANPDDVETLASLEFREDGGSTRVSLTQGPFKTEERRDLHRNGWSESFEKLEALLSSR
jgi:uncharacterized protein YndB with AHSA1/START domain